MNRSLHVIKLASDTGGYGLNCQKDGLTLAGYPLLFDDWSGLAPRSAAEIQDILDSVYGTEAALAADTLMNGLASVARFLNKGDLPLAMIGSLLLRLPEIPEVLPLSKKELNGAAKAGYNEGETRDQRGRWTDGAGGSGLQAPVPQVLPNAPNVPSHVTPAFLQATPALLETGEEGFETVAPGVMENLAPETIGLLGRLAPFLGGAVATVAGVLIATNRSNTSGGPVPGAPGLTYGSDEGVVTIYGEDASGNPMIVYHSLPDRDGFYYDDKGLIIGRHIGRAVLFDPEALLEIAAEKRESPADSEPPAGNRPPTAQESDEDRPRFCPPPTPENISRRSIWSVAYQSQITGLPPGFDVLFRGVRFDGCVEAIQHFQEAKGRMPEFLVGISDERFRRTTLYDRIMRQASRQSAAASGYYDDWYFADEYLYGFFTREFRLFHFDNLLVHHVDAIFFRRSEEAGAMEGNDPISWGSIWCPRHIHSPMYQ